MTFRARKPSARPTIRLRPLQVRRVSVGLSGPTKSSRRTQPNIEQKAAKETKGSHSLELRCHPYLLFHARLLSFWAFSEPTETGNNRGRDGPCGPPPAQIRT